MMRGWKTEMHLRDDESVSTVYKTYSLLDVRKVLTSIRRDEQNAGLPKRKLSPVFRYVLEDLYNMYFKDYAPKGAILEKIKIEDTKNYGI